MVPRLKAHVAPAEDWFSPCHLHGDSQPTLAPGPGTLTPSSDLYGHQACGTQQNIHLRKIQLNFKKENHSCQLPF